MQCRADAYEHVIEHTKSKVSRANSFVDALVYLCEKPRKPADIHLPVRYNRPEPTTGIEESVSQMTFSPTQSSDQQGGSSHRTVEPLSVAMDVNASESPLRSDPISPSTRTRVRHVRGKWGPSLYYF